MVINAWEIPAANKSGFAPEVSVKPVKAVIIPTTVPKRPSNGLMVAIVPSIFKFLSKLYLTSRALSSIFDSRLSLCKSLYFMQLTSRNPKDERFDISIDCLLFIKLFSIRFNICFERPSGTTNLFCKNHNRSIEIVITSTLHANNGHIKGPPALIKSFI